MKKYKEEVDDTEHRLKVVLNRMANGRKVSWVFYEEYAVTDRGEIIYKSDYADVKWPEPCP